MVRLERPYLAWLPTCLVDGKDCHEPLLLAHIEELVRLLRVDELDDLLGMGELLELSLAQNLVVEPDLILDDQGHSCQGDNLKDLPDLVVVVGVLEGLAVVLGLFLVLLNVVYPDFACLVDAEPFVHHGEVEYFSYQGLAGVADFVYEDRAETLLRRRLEEAL